MSDHYSGNEINLAPQKGPQAKFLASIADITLFGGGAGGGKTAGILLDCLRHLYISVTAIIFRRTREMIRKPGGIWDESYEFYSALGARPRETFLDWKFKEGLCVKFDGLQNEKDVFNYQGTALPIQKWDELTHFTFKQFFYMVSRCRSTTGIPGYIHATCNPDKDSWVRKFIDWWIDPETGFPIPERDGILRWFIREGDKFTWANSADELIKKFGISHMPMSVTFIRSKLTDNQILMGKDPLYLSKLMSLNRVERMQLLDGNWNVSFSAGEIFKKHWFEIIDEMPSDQEVQSQARAWDRAATEADPDNPSKDPDWTAGVKMILLKDGTFVVVDAIRDRLTPGGVEAMTLATAKRDGQKCKVKIFQDPGGAGVHERDSYLKLLGGFEVIVDKITKDKITSAKPASAAAEQGRVKLLRGNWNEAFLDELQGFPDAKHDDFTDSFTSCFNCLNGDNTGALSKEIVHTNLNQKTNVGTPVW